MAIDTVNYNRIKSEVMQRCIGCTNENFIALKHQFERDINSPRRMDNIRDLQELIKVLEKRNVLNKRNLSILIKIATCFQQHDLIVWINNQMDLARPQQFVENPNTNNGGTGNNQPVLNLQHGSKRDRIFDCIVECIGYKWKDLARSLNISEGKIDNLEQRYSTIPERTIQILMYYENLCPHTWHTLLEALNKCRRNDLRLEVMRILDSY